MIGDSRTGANVSQHGDAYRKSVAPGLHLLGVGRVSDYGEGTLDPNSNPEMTARLDNRSWQYQVIVFVVLVWLLFIRPKQKGRS